MQGMSCVSLLMADENNRDFTNMAYHECVASSASGRWDENVPEDPRVDMNFRVSRGKSGGKSKDRPKSSVKYTTTADSGPKPGLLKPRGHQTASQSIDKEESDKFDKILQSITQLHSSLQKKVNTEQSHKNQAQKKSS